MDEVKVIETAGALGPRIAVFKGGAPVFDWTEEEIGDDLAKALATMLTAVLGAEVALEREPK